MKATLIYLPHPYLVQPNMMAPLGLLYVAAAFKKLEANVIIKNFSGYDIQSAIDELEASDIFGITATSLELPLAHTFAGLIKNKFPSSKIILGGSITSTPELIDTSNIDSVVIGEGEIASELIFNDFTKGRPLDKIYRTPAINLDLLPLPLRDFNTKFTTASIITSRGCPFSCAFCASPKLDYNKMRYRSIKNILDEIEILKLHGATDLVIHDDMFTANKKRMIELCNYMGKLGIKFRINIRAKPLDMEMLRAAKEAGCTEAAIGIESFDQEVLTIFKKKTTVADNVHALHMCNKAGINTRLLLMIRTPAQTKKGLEQNKYWLNRLPYNKIACTNFVPIPGCDVWYNPNQYNIEILTRDLNEYNYGFFDSNGEIPLKPIFKLKDRTLDSFHQETEEFKTWLKETKLINRG